jgi:hypothetical protein
MPVDGDAEYFDYDSGWGTLEELEQWEQEQDDEWAVIRHQVGQLIEVMSAGAFLHIEYAAPTNGQTAPYARATAGPDGVLCEIISDAGLSRHQWRLSTHRLSAEGWLAPDRDVPNWRRIGVPRGDAAALILNAIRFGSVPVEATELRWSVGRIPDGPGPGRGVTLQQALRGVVQTLRNAE